jgi:hypothetical protein
MSDPEPGNLPDDLVGATDLASRRRWRATVVLRRDGDLGPARSITGMRSARHTRRRAMPKVEGSPGQSVLLSCPWGLAGRATDHVPIESFQYRFRQPLRTSARAAYSWCTDYGPDDGKLFSERTIRSVQRLSHDAFVLTDTTFPVGRPLRIQRLVRLNAARLAWTNTHLTGPFRHSQFWYQLVSDGPQTCHLEFTGLRLQTFPRPLSISDRTRRAAAYRRSDAGEWRRRLAPSLERDQRPLERLGPIERCLHGARSDADPGTVASIDHCAPALVGPPYYGPMDSAQRELEEGTARSKTGQR